MFMNNIYNNAFSLFNYSKIIPLIFFCLIKTICSLSISSHIIKEGKYPKAILLPSDNYFVVLNQGIYLYNSEMNFNKTIYNFTDEEIIYSLENETFLSQFEIENIFYILCITKKQYLYLFEYNAKYSPNNDFTLKYKDTGDYLNIVFHKSENLIFQFIVYFIKSKKIYFSLYEMNVQNLVKNKVRSSVVEFKDSYNTNNQNYDYNPLNGDYISCQQISNKGINNKELLICFYSLIKYREKKYCLLFICSTSLEEYQTVGASSFDINNNFTKINFMEYEFNNKLYNFKSMISNKENKCFIFFTDYYNQLYSLTYDIEKNEFIKLYEIDYCRNIKTYYFAEMNEDILICYNYFSKNGHYYDYFYLFFWITI